MEAALKKEDTEKKKRLLQCAREEFIEKGYSSASLRSICKKAGVTTGALYFFFQDKEDLYANLVEEPLHGLYEIIKTHYMAELLQVQDKTEDVAEADDYLATQKVVEYLYGHYDVFVMLLTKSQGSKYENIEERFVDITEKFYWKYLQTLVEQGTLKQMPEYLLHWIAHMQIDSFVHMITHETSKEQALKHFVPIVRYMQAGWAELFRQE